MTAEKRCCYCGATQDLRPYGPAGADVCFACAMATPERQRVAEVQFARRLAAAGPVAVLGGPDGPVPARVDN
jgi:hypothetical protein